MFIEPVWQQIWREEEGYIDSDQLIGYRALDEQGQVLAYGETPQEAQECGLQALWQSPRAEHVGV